MRSAPDNRFTIERNHRVKSRKDAVANDCRIWLQGSVRNAKGYVVDFNDSYESSLTDYIYP